MPLPELIFLVGHAGNSATPVCSGSAFQYLTSHGRAFARHGRLWGLSFLFYAQCLILSIFFVIRGMPKLYVKEIRYYNVINGSCKICRFRNHTIWGRDVSG
jgi:hypothetical protein